MSGRAHDLHGVVFDFWTVLAREPNVGHIAYWLCRCACGVEKVMRAGRLQDGSSKSCGCRPRDPRHGHTSRAHGSSPTYRSWASMVARCTNPAATGFAHYKRRGITICKRWRTFDNFLADMGERPAGTTLDRSNNDLGYKPGNCVWATRREQANNRVTNIWFEYRGQRYTMADLARTTGVSKDLLRSRLARHRNKNGRVWSVEEAVHEPLQRGVRFDLR